MQETKEEVTPKEFLIIHGFSVDAPNVKLMERLLDAYSSDFKKQLSSFKESYDNQCRRIDELNEKIALLEQSVEESKGFKQMVTEILKWTKVKDGRAVFTTSEETFNTYKKYLNNF